MDMQPGSQILRLHGGIMSTALPPSNLKRLRLVAWEYHIKPENPELFIQVAYKGFI
jgi:hypothetical protein